MAEIIDVIIEKLDEHWIKFVTAALLMGAGWLIGRWRTRKDWEKREFFDRLNVSLNIVADDTLKIRTILEKRCHEIFLNATAAEKVIDAARRTTPGSPLLPLPQDDYWYYLNSLLNEISEKFAEGQLKQDLGLTVNCAEYLLCLTSEAEGSVRMRKVRAMLIKKSVLLSLPEEQPKLAAEHHSTRWRTLHYLKTAFAKSPHMFLTIEICQ